MRLFNLLMLIVEISQEDVVGGKIRYIYDSEWKEVHNPDGEWNQVKIKSFLN